MADRKTVLDERAIRELLERRDERSSQGTARAENTNGGITIIVNITQCRKDPRRTGLWSVDNDYIG